ncbi:MAG: T9SS type A sorting domain-containing protein [Bacteroidia bacterium]
MKLKSTLFLTLGLITSFCHAQFYPGPDLTTPLQKAQQVILLNGKLTALGQLWSNGSYQNNTKEVVTTNSKGDVLFSENFYDNNGTLIRQSWSEGTTTYDGAGKLLTAWSKATSVDTLHFRVKWIYQTGYNAGGKLTYYNHVDSFYDGNTLTQTTVMVDSIYYNAAGKADRFDSYTKTISGVYALNWTTKITYDAGNNPVDVDYALTSNNDYAVLYRMKLTWDAQNRMTSHRYFPAYMYLQYKDSVYEQRSQYFSYDANGNLSLVVDSQYSGNGLAPNFIYNGFSFSSGKLMTIVRQSTSGFSDSMAYHRNATGLPDSVSIYFNIGNGFIYYGRKLYTAEPLTPTSAKEISSVALLVYPNPAREGITVVSDRAIQQCNILNLQGALMLSAKRNSKQISINTNELPKGIYLVQILDERGNYTRKLVIE